MSELMTLEQTAEYLHLHPVTLRNKARKGELPAIKLGRQWRFVREQLEAWLLEGGQTADPRGNWGKSDSMLALLRRQKGRIERLARRYGARNVLIFGSVARGEDDADSDVDLLVELEPGRSLLDLAGLKLALEQILGRPVDVVTKRGLRDRLRQRVLAEAVAL